MAASSPPFSSALGVSLTDRPRYYNAYGLHIRSDVPLPAASACQDDPAFADVVIHQVRSKPAPAPDGPIIASMPCAVHGTDMLVSRGPGGAWIWQRGTATFHIAPDVRHVHVYPEDEPDERAIGLGLAGPVLLYIVHKRGRSSLLASAVVTEQGAVGFLGRQGQGKSTITASFLRRGAPLLTDDALPLLPGIDGVYGMPGPPFMKVWSETAACTLQIPEELPSLTATFNKKLLALDGRYAVASTPSRLRALYLLDRYDPAMWGQSDVVVRALTPRESLTALLAHTSHHAFFLPHEMAPCLPLFARLVAQAPVRVLRYPSGFERQRTVYERVLEDLATQ